MLGNSNKMLKGELTNLTQKANKILEEELKKTRIKYNYSKIEILSVRSTGVMGDERTYEYAANVKLRKNKKFIWHDNEKFYEFINKLTSRIVGEVKGINRIVYDITLR